MEKISHTHQVVFGRKVAGCPRCDQLAAGAPVRSGWSCHGVEYSAAGRVEVHAGGARRVVSA